MATRKIKDAKDLSTNELIYFRGHAKATFLSDGRTVEEAVSGSSDEPVYCTDFDNTTIPFTRGVIRISGTVYNGIVHTMVFDQDLRRQMFYVVDNTTIFTRVTDGYDGWYEWTKLHV